MARQIGEIRDGKTEPAGPPDSDSMLVVAKLLENLDDILDRCRALTDDAGESDLRYRAQAAESPAAWFRDIARAVTEAKDQVEQLRLGRPVEAIGERSDEQDGWGEAERAERRYQTLVEQIPAIVYTQDTEEGSSDFLYVSPVIEQILGFTPDEWRSSDQWSRQLHAEDRERVWEEASRASAGRAAYLSEYRIHAKNGRVVWIRDEAVLVEGESGEPKFWHGIMTDITAHHDAEEQLQEARTRYQALVEKLPLITYIEKKEAPSGELDYISPQVEDILGYPMEEWLAGSAFWRTIVHPDDAEMVWRSATESWEAEAPYLVELRLIAADGRAVWIHDESVLVKSEEGEPQFWLGFMQDVTARRTAEEQLREAEIKYRALVEHTPAVTYITATDESTTTTYISPQVEEFFGHRPEQWMVPLEEWLPLVHPDDRERVLLENSRHDERSESFSSDYRVLIADGGDVWVHDQSILVHDDNGNPLYWQGVIIDVSEQRRAEDLERALEVERESSKKLLALDEMKNTFLTAVSHDLRTPLAAILGLALTLDRDDINLTPKEMRDLLGRIVSNARKLDRLVTDLLDLDRLSRGILELSRNPVDLGALVRRAVEDTDLISGRPVSIETDSVIVSVDAAKVERIVENLIANAVRHTPQHSQIWIKVRRGEEGAGLIIVEDQGPGVPEDMRDAIFEPFRQVQDAKEPSPGVGIGLSLVARFAELHGGRTWVTGRPGGGASFRVLLPRTATEPTETA